jgi:hypothetical protein
MFYSFLTGFTICYTLGRGAIQSGYVSPPVLPFPSLLTTSSPPSLFPCSADTTFVALAHDPEVLAERDPQLFELIRQAYPEVVTSV